MLLLLAVVAGMVYVIFKKTNAGPATEPEEQEEAGEQSEKAGGALWPSEWYYAVRNYPDFKPGVQAYTRALEQARGIGVTAARPRGSFPGFGAPWLVQGPANIGARVNTIKVHPTNPDIVYIGYSAGGVWKTTDGGLTWNPIFDDQTFLAIGDIELDPLDPETVYVGTGDPNISGYPFIGDGIWKSTDGGQTWSHLGLTAQRIVSRIIIHPTNPDIIYAATMGLPFERNSARGLYKTVDGGDTWQQILYIGNETGIIDLEMAPNNPNVLYAAAWDRIRNNQESVASGNNARVWKSADGGANWTMMGGGLPQNNKSRIGLAIDAQNGNRLLAMYANDTLTFHGIYVSDNGGQSWSPNSLIGLNPGFQSNFAWYFGKIFINPYNAQDWWALGVTTYRSIDGGQSWFQAVGWGQDVHVDHHDMAFLGPNSFLIATDGGLYRSDDDGNNWYKFENIPTTQFYRVAHNPHLPDFYYGGAQDNGTLGGTDTEMEAWFRIYGGDGFQAVFHPQDPNIFYCEWQNGGIVGTLDGGWFESATAGIEPSDRRHWDMQYILSQHDPNIFYTGTYRVYAGYGHLPQWTPISDDLTDGNIFGGRFHTISTLHESPINPEILYVGTTDGNVWRGNPLSQVWTNITAGLPNRYVSSVKASPTYANRVYVSHSGYRDNDFSPLLYRSDDQGATWTPIGGDLPALAINDIQVLPGHQDSVLFVATDGGVWGTLDGGQHWERLGTGMPYVAVYDLDINPAEKMLIAGTHARSIMSFPLDSLTIGGDVSTDAPTGPKPPTLSVTPSVADYQTTLAIEHLSLKKNADILIIDLNGRLLGQYELRGGARSERRIDLSGYAPGVYVALARTDGRVWGQKKFVVAR